MKDFENIPANRIEYLCQLWSNALDAKMDWLNYEEADEYAEVLFDSYKRLSDLFCDGVLRISEMEHVSCAELRRYIKWLVAQDEKAAKANENCCVKVEESETIAPFVIGNIFEGDLEW